MIRGLPIAALRALLGLLWLAALGACGNESAESSWVARIDGQSIVLADLRRRIESSAEKSPGTPREELLTVELDRLVNRRIGLNRARALSIQISDGEADERILSIHGSDFGPVDVRYRTRVKSQMLIDRAALMDLAHRVEVPESVLIQHFEEHREEYRKLERVQIRQIVVEDREKAAQLLGELGDGVDFGELARAHSLAPEAEDEGLLPAFERGELPEVFDRAFDLDTGERSEVIESRHGFHIFLLVERFPPVEPEYADVRASLAEELAKDRLADLRRGWLRNLRRQAQIELNEPLLETLR